ncbi:MAG: Gfo/Idh/MocA family oxidoreductase [Lentisphaeria bacterium]|nr:Gfo/Idh/MocA family oxidoreductase [Lentisphaeria bacterium]
MTKLRVIQIGTGPMVHSAHAVTALRGLDEIYHLEAIVEEDSERRDFIRNTPPYAGLPFISWEEAQRRNPDAFIIETDEHRLVENAIRSLEAGYHTYMDKPGSEDAAQFHRMCRIAEKNRRVLTLGYMFRGNPAVQYALELKKQGKLGRIFSVEGQMSCPGGPGYRRTLPRFKGGMMYYLGCHLIDMVVHFCGFPDEVMPMNTCTGIDEDCIDYGFCVFRYKNGLSFVKTCAAEVNGNARRSIIISGTQGSFEIQPIELPRKDGWDDTIARETIGIQAGFDNSHPVSFPPHRRYDWLFQNFAKYIRGEAVNPYSGEYEAKLHDLILQACR